MYFRVFVFILISALNVETIRADVLEEVLVSADDDEKSLLDKNTTYQHSKHVQKCRRYLLAVSGVGGLTLLTLSGEFLIRPLLSKEAEKRLHKRARKSLSAKIKGFDHVFPPELLGDFDGNGLRPNFKSKYPVTIAGNTSFYWKKKKSSDSEWVYELVDRGPYNQDIAKHVGYSTDEGFAEILDKAKLRMPQKASAGADFKIQLVVKKNSNKELRMHVQLMMVEETFAKFVSRSGQRGSELFSEPEIKPEPIVYEEQRFVFSNN